MRLPPLPNEHPSVSPGKKYAVERQYVMQPLPIAGHVSPWLVFHLMTWKRVLQARGDPFPDH